ncbi:MAG: cytochrome c-type biogenesis protein CcmH [Terriglobales bacterium]
MKLAFMTEGLRFGVAQRLSAAIKAVSSVSALAAEGRRTQLIRTVQALSLIAAVFLFLAAAPTPDARFHDLGHRMMCACGCAQILLECNHVGCTYSDKMINQLQTALDKGDNDDLILQGFVQEYGPTVIAAPTATGFNRVAWIMPFAVLALGIAFAVHTVRSWKNRPAPALADGIVIPQGHELDDLRARARKETDL